MDDDIFKHLLDSEDLLVRRAYEIKRKKGEIEGYRKGLVALKEELQEAVKELEDKSTELSQAKYQQQTKSRQLELINGKLGELKEEFQCIVKEKDELKEERDKEREMYRVKAAHYATLFNNENEQLESCDLSVIQKLRSAEAEIETKRKETACLEEESKRMSAQCAEYNIKDLEERRDILVSKKRELCPVIREPHSDTILQLVQNIEKFEREIKLMSQELVRMRSEIARDPEVLHQPLPRNDERLVYQLTAQTKTSQLTQNTLPQCTPQFTQNTLPQCPPQTLQFRDGRCVVPSISPYFNPLFNVNMTTTHHSPISDDMFDDGIVDDDLIMLCNEAENLN